MDDAIAYLRGAIIPQGGAQPFTPVVIVLLLLGLVAQWPRLEQLAIRLVPPPTLRRAAVYGTVVLVAIMLLPVSSVDFIYFQF
jgi:hypothetical protein